MEYHKRDGTVELEEAAAAEAAGRPYRFIRPEVDPTWTPGVKKVKTVVEIDHTHGVLSKDEVRTLQKHFDEKIEAINNDNLLKFGEDYERVEELPKDDFKTLVREMCKLNGVSPLPTKKDLEQAFLQADVDGGGTIDWGEFTGLYAGVKRGDVKGLGGPTTFMKAKAAAKMLSEAEARIRAMAKAKFLEMEEKVALEKAKAKFELQQELDAAKRGKKEEEKEKAKLKTRVSVFDGGGMEDVEVDMTDGGVLTPTELAMLKKHFDERVDALNERRYWYQPLHI